MVAAILCASIAISINSSMCNSMHDLSLLISLVLAIFISTCFASRKEQYNKVSKVCAKEKVLSSTSMPLHIKPSRTVKVLEAWTCKWTEVGEGPLPKSRSVCIAVVLDDAHKVHGKQMRGLKIEGVAKVCRGSHAFVRVAGESFLRVAFAAAPFGSSSGHGFLADAKPVLYAGELEVDEDSRLIRWNNLSGTYRPDSSMAFQAGLPIDRFFPVQPPGVCACIRSKGSSRSTG